MTDHHGKTTTGTAVNVRPPTDAKRRHGTDYCAIAQIAVNRDNVSNYSEYSNRNSVTRIRFYPFFLPRCT